MKKILFTASLVGLLILSGCSKKDNSKTEESNNILIQYFKKAEGFLGQDTTQVKSMLEKEGWVFDMYDGGLWYESKDGYAEFIIEETDGVVDDVTFWFEYEYDTSLNNNETYLTFHKYLGASHKLPNGTSVDFEECYYNLDKKDDKVFITDNYGDFINNYDAIWYNTYGSFVVLYEQEEKDKMYIIRDDDSFYVSVRQ